MNQVERVHSGDIFIATVVFFGQLGIALLLFTVGRKRLPPALYRVAVLLYALVSAVCAFSFYLTFSPSALYSSLTRSVASGVEILWGIVSANTVVIYFIYRFVARRIAAPHMSGRRMLLRGAATAAVAAPLAVAGFGALIERTRFVVREVDFPIPNLHPDLEGLRVAQISDIHASPFLSVKDVARVVDMTNELKPHLSLVTGDLISEVGDPLEATIDQLKRLRADAGILGCLGNHEAYARCQNLTTLYARERGIHFLRHEARQLQWGKAVLNVAGVDFQPFRHKELYLLGADRLVVPGAANLLLSHNPDVFPVAVQQGYDAVVGGHTHGGQVTVEIFNQSLNFARFFTPFVAGLYRMRDRSCYVTAGIGTIGMPVRVGAEPEITLLRLRRA